MKTALSPRELLKKASSFEKKKEDLVEKYKESILVLKNEKLLTVVEIEKFLSDNGIDIKKHRLQKFFRENKNTNDKKTALNNEEQSS
jgi:hypothetical protein